MVTAPFSRLARIREEVEQQRRTVEDLRRSGHVCEDAERQLENLLAELRIAERFEDDATG